MCERERERDEGWMEIMVSPAAQTGWNSLDQLLQLRSFVGVFRIVLAYLCAVNKTSRL